MVLSKYRALGVACAVLACAAAVVAGVAGGCGGCIETAAGGCVPMACYYAFITVTVVEVLAAAVLLGLALVKCKVGRRWLACCGIGAQALCWLVTFAPLPGLCASWDMACYGTAWACLALQCATVVLAAVAAALADPKRAQLPKKEL